MASASVSSFFLTETTSMSMYCMNIVPSGEQALLGHTPRDASVSHIPPLQGMMGFPERDRPGYGLEACGCPWVARHGQVQPPAVAPTVRRPFSGGRFAIPDGLGVGFAPAIWICANS